MNGFFSGTQWDNYLKSFQLLIVNNFWVNNWNNCDLVAFDLP